MSFLNVNTFLLIILFIIYYSFKIQDSFGSPNKDNESPNDNDTNNINKNQQNDEQNENLQKIDDFTSSIINFKLKTNLSILISIIENKLHKIKHEFFIFLKNNKNPKNSINFYDYKKLNKNLKMSIILHKINKCSFNLIKIYKTYRLRQKYKNFLLWQEKINIEKNNKKIENDAKEKYNKIYENKISDTMNLIKKKEKNIEELKSQEKKISENIKQKEKQKEEINKKMKELEQKVDEISKINEKLEKEKNEKETLTNSNTFSSLNKENNEEIIKELELRILELDKEKTERDAYFKNFHEEMINMMIIFEQKTQKILKMQNNEHPQKKLEINTGGEMFDSLNHFNDFGSSDTLKGNNGKKFFGNEKQFNNNKLGNLDIGHGNKPKNKTNSGTVGSVSTSHGIKGNDNREMFINYTDIFKNKI